MNALPLEALCLTIAGEVFHVRAVADATDLLDDLMAQADDHPDVEDERLPYWAELWPSSIALAEYILTTGILDADTRVIELGCGSALAGLAAARCGAEVILTDYQQPALDLATTNFLANDLPAPATRCMDWRHPDPDLKADLLLAADVAYEERFFDPLIDTFKALLNPGGTILLSEPHRELAHQFFDRLEERGFAYTLHDRQAPSGSCMIPVGIYEIYRLTG